jgi:excisionase family DNA binding protein
VANPFFRNSKEQSVTTQMLTVRAAAARLGVHENTIRNWTDTGIVQAIRLPGSGFRRIPLAEVARVEAEMIGRYENPQSLTGPVTTLKSLPADLIGRVELPNI